MTPHLIKLVTSCSQGKRAKESQAAYGFVLFTSLLSINIGCGCLALGGRTELQIGM